MSDELVKMEQSLEVEEAEEKAVMGQENLFKPLVNDARSTLRRLMLNSRNEKIQRETAESVLDRAGETKKQDNRIATQIIIKDSQINMLAQVAKELLDE
jgi:hypothetical protein